MAVSKKLYIPNRLSVLHHVRRAVKIFIHSYIDEKWEFRLILAVDEAISNTIQHGFPSGNKTKIELELMKDEIGFTFIIRDEGIHFSNLEKKVTQVNSNSIRENGFGIHLIQSIMEVYHISKNDIGNILILKKSFLSMKS